MRLALAAVALVVAVGPGMAAPCVTYGPRVTLTGVIHKAIAYGPPGYGEHPKTDSKEVYESLSLDSPLCVLQGDEDTDVAESGVRQVELDRDNGATIAADGAHISATGMLFHRYTAHHHTKVLLAVDQVH